MDPTSAQLYFPRALAIDATGNIDVADTFDNRVRTIATDGRITTVAGKQVAGSPAITARPPRLPLTRRKGWLWTVLATCISPMPRVRQVNAGGIINTLAALGGPAPVVRSSSLAVDAHNNVFAAALARVEKSSLQPAPSARLREWYSRLLWRQWLGS